MFRVKITSLLVTILAIFLSACVPVVPNTPLPGSILSENTAISPQAATSTPFMPISGSPVASVDPASMPVLQSFPSQTIYQSPSLGIQFGYPSTWYLRETSERVTLTSFEPSNPPHKLEWAYDTTSMQFGYLVFVTRPTFDTWIEQARQAAQAEGFSISTEERFLIASQPAVRLSLVSGSGGILNRVLIYELAGRYFEINIEGNYNSNLARTVLDSIQPYLPYGLKPADSATPAAGTCGEAQFDPANIVLGLDASGLPLGGRCVAVDPTLRIRLVNQSNSPIAIQFADYYLSLPVWGEALLDKPVGQYLAAGVHQLTLGPELWVKTNAPTPIPSPIVTAPPPIVEYNNSLGRYRLNLPGDWIITETNSSSNEVIFSPPNAEPFVSYLSISQDTRTLDQVIDYYTQNMGALNVVREDTMFYGYPAVKYIYASGRNEYFIPFGNQLFLVATDRPNNGTVQSILMTYRFMAPPQPITYDATMADSGRTFVMNIGDKLRLNLDLNYGWTSITISNPAVIAGAGDGYFAFTSGTTTLTATGSPLCLNSTPPCAMPSILYTITVVVK